MDRVLAESRCGDDVSVERAPVDAVVGSLAGWAKVIDAGPDSTAPELGAPVDADGAIADIQFRWASGEIERLPVRITYAWSADVREAIIDEESEVWAGLLPSERAWETPFVLVISQDGFAFSGLCNATVTELMISLFGDDAVGDVRQMMTMTGAESAAFMAAAWTERSAGAPPPPSWDLPQYVPGLADLPAAADVATEYRRLILTLNGTPIEPDVVVCAATDSYVGDCATLGSHGVDESGNFIVDLAVYAAPGQDIRLVYLPSDEPSHFETLTRIDVEATSAHPARVSLDVSVSGRLTASEP